MNLSKHMVEALRTVAWGTIPDADGASFPALERRGLVAQRDGAWKRRYRLTEAGIAECVEHGVYDDAQALTARAKLKNERAIAQLGGVS